MGSCLGHRFPATKFRRGPALVQFDKIESRDALSLAVRIAVVSSIFLACVLKAPTHAGKMAIDYGTGCGASTSARFP